MAEKLLSDFETSEEILDETDVVLRDQIADAKNSREFLNMAPMEPTPKPVYLGSAIPFLAALGGIIVLAVLIYKIADLYLAGYCIRVPEEEDIEEIDQGGPGNFEELMRDRAEEKGYVRVCEERPTLRHHQLLLEQADDIRKQEFERLEAAMRSDGDTEMDDLFCTMSESMEDLSTKPDRMKELAAFTEGAVDASQVHSNIEIVATGLNVVEVLDGEVTRDAQTCMVNAEAPVDVHLTSE